MIGVLETVASFVLVLGILVFVHEFGHFLLAKRFGIGVPVFSLGFGPRLFGFRRGETDYRVSAIPLGGYVRMKGDESDEDRKGAPDELYSRPRWQRLLVFAAGAVFNVLLALGVAWIAFWAYGKDEVPAPTTYPVVAEVLKGSPAATAGIERGDRIVEIAGHDMRDPQTELDEVLLSPGTRKPVVVERGGARRTLTLDTGMDARYHLGDPGWLLLRDNPSEPTIDQVAHGSPAEKAGLRPGDKVLGADDKRPIDEVHLRALLGASGGRSVRLRIGRAGSEMEVAVVPRDEGGGRAVIGVLFKVPGVYHRDLGPGEAAVASLRYNLEISKTLFVTLGKLVHRDISVRAFSGPIEIARVSREMVRALESFLRFLAFISLQLGILNLLPIPVLDGGHILIIAVEAVIRRELSEKVKERVMQAGLVLLLAFFGTVMYFDVIKTWFSS